jgi:catechol 2,3-dioxygenase-like lactoylglutathione lyase family enzyme
VTFTLGRLAQIIHVTDDLAASRQLYGDVLGGESYYEGYSPFEKRDASIYAIGEATIEPMSPSDEPGALDMPVGRFLVRFGPRLHSIAINATGVRGLADHLISSGIRVVGPGGIPVSDLSDSGPVSIYTHPKDSHVLIEFVDFGQPLMPTSPRLAPDYDPAGRAVRHPAGVIGAAYATVIVADLDRALEFFTGVLGCAVLGGEADGDPSVRVRLGTELVVELRSPGRPGSEAATALETDGEGLYSLTLRSIDVDRAASHLRTAGILDRIEPDGRLVLDRGACGGARLRIVSAD